MTGTSLQGTPRADPRILLQTKSLVFGAEHMAMREYIEGSVANIRRGFGVEFNLTSETDDELAESFLKQMLDDGHARRV